MNASPSRSLRDELVEEPDRFDFDAAVAVMMRAAGCADPTEGIRFEAVSGLGFVAADFDAVAYEANRFRARTGMLGLTGPGGVLPRPYTEAVNDEQRHRSGALAAFLDLLAQRSLAQFAAAGIKYRPHRAADSAAIAGETGAQPQDGMRDALLALTGHALPGLLERLPLGIDPILYYAGAFASRPRSADRLAAILSDWLGESVEVEQFAGVWLAIDPGERTALPRAGAVRQFNRLGVDAAIGTRVWDLQSRIVLRVGPLRLDGFEAMLPGRPQFRRIVALARAYLDREVTFVINAVLAADAVPPLHLCPDRSPLLGWNSWLPTSAPRRRDASEAVFAPLEDGTTGKAA